MIRANSVPMRWQHMTKAALLPAVLLLFAASNAFGAVQYAITDLGTLSGGSYSSANDINNSGQVVGLAGIGWGRPFLYTGSGPMRDLGTLGGACGCACDINDSGQVVGWANPSGSDNDAGPPFLYNDSGPMQDLNNLIAPSSGWVLTDATAINDKGQIVGSGDNPAGQRHAFLYGTSGVIQDLGTLGGASSSANGINESGQVVGGASTSAGQRHAFLYGASGVIQDLGTLGGASSSANGINESGQVVGGASTSAGQSHAFLYGANGVMQDLGTLGGPWSYANDINNGGQVVGLATMSDYKYRAFLYSGSGPMQDLNNLIVPSSGWNLEYASAINDKGQIVGSGTNPAGQTRAFLLTPLNPASRTYTATAPPTTTNPTDRLAEWNGTSWVPVAAGSISDDVHVLVHGWAPGERDWVDSNGGSDARVWNATTAAGTNWFQPFTDLADSIKTHSGDRVIAYSWINGAATGDDPVAMDIYAAQSQVLAGVEGGPLKKALEAAIGPNDVNLQLIGHSHGAKVATLATQQLVQSGIPVKQLSLLDSPDNASTPSTAKNSLDSYLSTLPIGSGPNKTFVDNYFTTFGREYGDNVINVKLDGPYNPVDDHGYPIEWYTRSASEPNWDHVGLDWSPLTYNGGQSLTSNDWIQIWRNISGPGFNYDMELNLEADSLGTTVTNIVVRAINGLQTLFQTNNVTGLVDDRLLFTKDSPAFWDSTFIKNEGDIAIQFNYEFIQTGEGDQLAVWVDDEMMFVVTGLWAGTGQQIGAFDISGLEIGSHTMTVALHDYGTAPAQFSIGDFTVLSVPEPSAIVMGFTGVVCLLLLAWRHRRRT